MDDLFAPLVLGLLTWVVNSKMPVVISCDCFNDLSHDEMKQLKEEYLLSKQEKLKEQEEDGVSVDKED